MRHCAGVLLHDLSFFVLWYRGDINNDCLEDVLRVGVYRVGEVACLRAGFSYCSSGTVAKERRFVSPQGDSMIAPVVIAAHVHCACDRLCLFS